MDCYTLTLNERRSIFQPRATLKQSLQEPPLGSPKRCRGTAGSRRNALYNANGTLAGKRPTPPGVPPLGIGSIYDVLECMVLRLQAVEGLLAGRGQSRQAGIAEERCVPDLSEALALER
eukprot:15433461-Alexandrium_andersonii.AAC.1